MADTITIPSPSVFLRASPDPVPRLDTSQQVFDDEQNKTAAAKKRNTTRKKSVASTSKPRRDGAAVAKPKQSKSRNGCVTCKAKRLKCDEKKPGCEQCKKRNVDCGGYKKDFKWRPFEETNVASNIAKQNNGSLIVLGNAADSSGKRSPVSPPTRAPSSEAPAQLSSSFAQQLFVAAPAQPSVPRATSAEKERSVHNSSRTSPAEAQAEQAASPTDSANDAGTSSRGSPHGITAVDGSPKENDMTTTAMMPGTKEVFDFDMHFMDEFLNMTDPPLMEDMEMDFKNVEELTPIVPDYDAWAQQLSHCPTFQDDSTMSSPPAMVFPQRITYMYEQPSFAQTSPEMLMLRFDRLTCGILSIKDGPNENPWRTLIWPMAQTSPALYHAISSMTAFHSSRDIPALRVAGHEHKSESVRNLLEGIEESTMNLDTAIATTLALAFAETWDQHLSSGNDHIQGA
ncbi:hypothetical protein KCU63_g14058, partial [Aureobasidium melanogenum]